MAESILFNIVEKILISLGQHALQDLISSWGARRDLEKLEGTIRFIQARVHDAEKRREQESSEVIKEWLGRLRQVLYCAEDLLDDVYTISCREQRANRSKLAHKVRVAFSRSNPFGFNRKMVQEIKSIREELDDLKSEMEGLNFSVCLTTDQQPISRLVVKRETISFVQTESVIGRKNDKNNILDMLVDPKYAEESVTVIPIVGFGGLGKTTLAQLVFNDERVEEHFDLARWACVPQINDQNEILGKILSALTEMSCQGVSREQVQSQIRTAVKGKKFLLVLDDIWDESRDRWLDLLSLLQCGNRGSKIIVTTRSDVVATIVGTVPEAYKLGLLTPEDSWNLFKMLAFKKGQEESNPNLVRIGGEIVKNCGNVPLAIRVVGSLLYSKQTEKEWELFRDAQLLKAKLIDLNDIMPVLKLSYDYLPPALKRCFAYCSLFPKDYEFESTELVRLWIAQGYVEPIDESLSMEDVGDQYFLELLRRNFFQDVEDFETSDVINVKMHDLVHDLAQHVAGDQCSIVDRLGVKLTSRVTHVNFCARAQLRDAPQSLLGAKNLRTLLLENYSSPESTFRGILRFRSLRALESSMIKVVPDSINRLTHLRYLNLSYSPIQFLPIGITRLYNLETLNLDYCEALKKLPVGFTKLANLRHLGIEECPFADLPHNFGRMKSLRELNRFIVGQNNGLDTLADLNLRGSLEIECRRWRTNTVLEAQAAKLKDKKQLTSVSFCFQYQGTQPAVASQDEELLFESLHLPPSLKELCFSGLLGNSFPRDMLYDLPKLANICIQQCDSCQALPLFSQLPLLKCLKFEGLKALEYVEADYIRVSGEAYFPVLESLTLETMQELKRWSKAEPGDSLQLRHCYVFPRLRTLRIVRCRKLTSLPSTPHLESLTVLYTHGKLLKSILASLSSTSSTPTLRSLSMESIEPIIRLNLRHQYLIKKLFIKGCGSLRNISDGIQCLYALEELIIEECHDLDAWDDTDGISAWGGFKGLRTLCLSDVSRLELLPHGISCLSMLQHLIIIDLPNLTELPQQIGRLSQLRRLEIYKCQKLISLPESLCGLTSLKRLKIHDCPDLEKRCQQPDGEDWPLIRHIPDVSFRYNW
ncbi:putative disease resistance protein RGA4 [Silene latifolia]|uniref:putative disease resistance protein RGA4 n=1 Tax=Silene latifolia TaxID=37657 RepID=UPI003D7809D9